MVFCIVLSDSLCGIEMNECCECKNPVKGTVCDTSSGSLLVCQPKGICLSSPNFLDVADIIQNYIARIMKL